MLRGRAVKGRRSPFAATRASVHMQGEPPGAALALKIWPTTAPLARTSKSSSFHSPERQEARLVDILGLHSGGLELWSALRRCVGIRLVTDGGHDVLFLVEQIIVDDASLEEISYE